ncbi:hypothetical protein C0674_14190 [Sporolactobacillus terrae]|uniref:Uncharacterized protein n=1 Tax=Sporolactobacillus terrae TaxID=269673 RepID=A0ABX5QAM2_9BACL|nr:hypothetical protein C0674_14190 [Sporolactobacillus terrae]QAA26615.1 hypothetical protein C0679_14175 [Sporolactobacillus terrae]
MRPRQASNRSDDSAPKRHESITQGWRLRTGRFLPGFSEKVYDFWSRCASNAQMLWRLREYRPKETPQINWVSEEARGAPAASEQPKRRFSTEKTRVHHTRLEIKDRAEQV